MNIQLVRLCVKRPSAELLRDEHGDVGRLDGSDDEGEGGGRVDLHAQWELNWNLKYKTAYQHIKDIEEAKHVHRRR